MHLDNQQRQFRPDPVAVRLVIIGMPLGTFVSALVLAADGWSWIWTALITVVSIVGLFEWARFLGLSRAWCLAYAISPFLLSLSVGFFTAYVLGIEPELIIQLFRLLVASFFWISWPVMLVFGAMLFSRSSGIRMVARIVWGVGGWWIMVSLSFTMFWLTSQWSFALFLLLTVAATDTAALLAGQRFGHRLLAPRILSGKTWVGLGAGLAAAAVVGACLPPLLSFVDTTPGVRWDRLGMGYGLLYGLAIGVCAVIGDFAVSTLKRSAGVKDSDWFDGLLFGHGGVRGALDIIGSLLLATPLFALVSVAEAWVFQFFRGAGPF